MHREHIADIEARIAGADREAERERLLASAEERTRIAREADAVSGDRGQDGDRRHDYQGHFSSLSLIN
jgi:hypothetical protein